VRRRWVRQLVRGTVIVHLKSATHSFKGVLAGEYHDCIVLRDVSVLEADGQTTLAGEVGVPRENIDFLQVTA